MNWQHIDDLLHGEMTSEKLATAMERLVLAAMLGRIIGADRELKHRPAGLRTDEQKEFLRQRKASAVLGGATSLGPVELE